MMRMFSLIAIVGWFAVAVAGAKPPEPVDPSGAIGSASAASKPRPPEPTEAPAVAAKAPPMPPAAPMPPATPGTVSFKRDIAPLLVQNCVACHGPDKAQSNYRLDTFERLAKPGENELPPFVAGKTDDGEWLRLLTSTDKKERMPKDGDPLPAAAIAKIKTWIAEGARFDGPSPQAPLASYLPRVPHPAPPEVYPAPVPITALAFSPSGQELAVGGYHEITFWNPADGKLLRRLKNFPQRIHAITYSPNGETIAVAAGTPGRLGEAKLIRASDGNEVHLLATTADEAFDVAFSPDGKKLAIAAADRAIRIVSAETGAPVRTIENHADWVMAVAWSPDGSKLASASRDKTSKAFDAATGQLLATFSTHGEAVYGVAFANDGASVLSTGRDSKLRQWKVADAAQMGEVGFGGEAFKLSAVGDFVFAASSDKSARQLRRTDRNQVRTFSGAEDWLYVTVAHLPTKRVAAGGFDGKVHVWNLDDGKPVVKFTAAPGITR